MRQVSATKELNRLNQRIKELEATIKRLNGVYHNQRKSNNELSDKLESAEATIQAAKALAERWRKEDLLLLRSCGSELLEILDTPQESSDE